ncbi:STAS domain-containing protein [Brachyspira alvinipulli]|uniref:STAS domain-containing protein n=1 Tax=Brachyspira alvinipulli TaxID=84379 RepID=UPI0004866568|nr:STAS domain-containing protein [Brachyspira alvinipulli]
MAIEFYNEYISIVMEANLSSSEEIEKFVEDSNEACNIRMPVVVLDMKNVREINSAGIAKILKLYKNLQSLKVKLFMINLHESVTPILKSLMIFSLIKYFDDPKDFLL